MLSEVISGIVGAGVGSLLTWLLGAPDRRQARKATEAQLKLAELEAERERRDAQERSAIARERIVQDKRKLYNLMRRIDGIECDYQFPPGPTSANFNVNQIRLMNQNIESIQDALVEVDLPETKAVLGVTIRCPENPSAPWTELGKICESDFLPIQATYRKLKNEIQRQSPGE
jgi:hypothetical protein